MRLNGLDITSIIFIALVTPVLGVSQKNNDVTTSGKQQKKKPNIIYVLTDQWRASATGYAGDPNVKTPNLDKLSAVSINMTNAVSVLPVCTPHRAALLTGRYPTSTGMFMNDLHLPEKELTMAEIYKQAGYNTAYIGKWHLDGKGRTSYIPQERRQGFEYWKANECSHNYNRSPYYTGNDSTKYFWEGYDAIAQTKDAQQYILDRSKDNKPFILMLAYGGPHFPHETAPKRFKELYNASSINLAPNVGDSMTSKARSEAVGYYAHRTAIDSCIGALRNTMIQAGIDDNTIFVFTSDHGEMLGAHNTPPAKKQRPWDESIKVPFLLHYPELLGSTGKVVHTPISTPDILPTLLALCGVKKPPTIEGEDLSGVIKGDRKSQDRAVLFMNLAPFDEARKVNEYRGIRTARYTYVRNLHGPWLFYDNEKDPYQLNNLINDPAVKSLSDELNNILQERLNAIGDDFQPRDYYVKRWNLKVDAEGKIAYGPGPYEGQTPTLTGDVDRK